MFEERVDLSNDMTWRQMIAVGVRRVILARGELDKLEGPGYAARRAELRREARARDRQAAASSQNEAEGSEATEEEATRERTYVCRKVKNSQARRERREWEDREVA